MKYTIVSELTQENLIDQVEKFILDGWEPIGGIAVHQPFENRSAGSADNVLTACKYYYHQAMINRSVSYVTQPTKEQS